MYQPKLLKPMLICFQILYRMILINLVISCIFLSIFKTAAITPVHKKLKLNKSNYRPVSVIPNISKLFERCMHRQISEYFETIFWKFQCGFQKRLSISHGSKLQKSIRSGKGIWCFANCPLESFWLPSTWPSRLPVWFALGVLLLRMNEFDLLIFILKKRFSVLHSRG